MRGGSGRHDGRVDDVADELLRALRDAPEWEVERAAVALLATAPDPLPVVRALAARAPDGARDGVLAAVARYGRGEPREEAERALVREEPAPVLGAWRTRAMDGGALLLADVRAGDRGLLCAVTVAADVLVDGTLVGEVDGERHAELLAAFAAAEPAEPVVATDPADALARIATAVERTPGAVPYDVALALVVLDATQAVPLWERPHAAPPSTTEGIDVASAALIDDLTLRFVATHPDDPEIRAYGPVTVRLLLEHQVLHGRSKSPLDWDPEDVATFLLVACPPSLPRERALVTAVPRIVRAFLRFAAGATDDPESTRAQVDAVLDQVEPQYAALTAPLLAPAPKPGAAADPERRRREQRKAQRAARKRSRRGR